MRCLLDTNVMLWFLEDAKELSETARTTLTNGENNLYWSAISHWELLVKISLGKLVLSSNWPAVLDDQLRRNRINELPLLRSHCEPTLSLPWHHRDPFDRLLICQAMVEELVLISRDRQM